MTTLYRVLSDEESKSVTRWQAPELGKDAVSVASTRQQANPQIPDDKANVTALLGSRDQKIGQSKTFRSIADSVSAVNGFTGAEQHNSAAEGNSSASSQVVSSELLQASYDEGYRKGYADGSSALQQQSVTELRNIILALGNASSKPDESQLENELVAMVVDIARLVLREELHVTPEHIHNIVLAGLDQIPGYSPNQCVMLHPLDANIVREKLSENTSVSILDDNSLNRGDCHIVSGASSIDAGVNDWLKVISRQLGFVSSLDDIDE